MIRGASLLFTAAVLGLATAASNAQPTYPERAVKIVVPVPPGPMLDVLPRVLGEKLSANWGKPVIIENRPGFAQNIGAEAVFRSAPDGHTLLVSPPGPLVVSEHLYSNLAFVPAAFAPVTTLIRFPLVLVAAPNLSASNLSELVAYAKANPGKLTFGSAGVGTTPHLAMEKLAKEADLKMIHVPYQGFGPAQTDLIAGRISLMLDAPGNVLPLITAGKLKALAVTGGSRIPELPHVSAISEAVPGFVHEEWFAVVAPPNTPDQILAKLSADIADIMGSSEMRARLATYHVRSATSSPAETATFLRSQSEHWARLISSLHIEKQAAR